MRTRAGRRTLRHAAQEARLVHSLFVYKTLTTERTP